MWSIFQKRLSELKLIDRILSIHGYIDDLNEASDFDAALCLLVLHHTSAQEREKIISGVSKRLKKNGLFIVAEMSLGENPQESEASLAQWQSLVRLGGAPEEKVKIIPEVFRTHLHMLSATESKDLLNLSGFGQPIQFFQSMLMRAWICKKS